MEGIGRSAVQRAVAVALISCGTLLGLAGTDLVLPAIPTLPEVLGGSPTQAQLVLAAYVAGSGLGLLAFGELGARFDQRKLVFGALLLLAMSSFAATRASSILALIHIRFLQGAVSSSAAVFAPGIIRALYPEKQAVRAIGLLGSCESLVPALAPIAGVWLLSRSGWRGSFVTMGGLALILAVVLVLFGRSLPSGPTQTRAGSYLALLRNSLFLRYALSHAATLGGLLVLVFGAPAVIVATMHGTLGNFIEMQIAGIACFILGANTSGLLVARYGNERVVIGGSALSAVGACCILGYALTAGSSPHLLAALFVPMNLGLGFRGPPGFLQAIVASDGDDSRGAALVILAILLVTAAGTAVAAPLITAGLLPLAAIAAAISCSSVLVLALLR